MYHMMIIDDEEIVRNGLKHILPWEEYGFTICAEGFDGLDGLDKILKHNPSLVLIDLKMPGLGGLDVIKKAREQGFTGRFYILTGYSDFEFAKSAISLGVKEYLLKPIDEDELLEHLIKLKQELDKEQKQKEDIDQSYQNARNEVLRQILFYAVNDKQALGNKVSMYHLDFSYPMYCAAILCSTHTEAGMPVQPSAAHLAIMLSSIEHETDYVSVEDKWVLILKGRSYKDYLKSLQKNNERLKKLKGEQYFITIGHNVSYFEDIHYSYECAKFLLEYRFSFVEEFYISIQNFETSAVIEEVNFSNKIFPLMEIGEEEAIKSELYIIRDKCKNCMMKESDIKMMFSHNLSLLYIILEERYPNKKSELPSYKKFISDIKKSESLEELIALMECYLYKLSRIIADADSKNVVKRVYIYIEKNYQNDLKLEYISRMFNYNSAYLGKIFKKEIGESFNNVIDKIRIENAKTLLAETNMKVYQVSEKVGYGNIDYFYSKFKKYVGISPKEFKKQVCAE